MNAEMVTGLYLVWTLVARFNNTLHLILSFEYEIISFILPCYFPMDCRKCSYTLSDPDLGIFISTPLFTCRYYYYCSIVAHKHRSPAIVFYSV